METSYVNNIQMNFFKYLHQYVNENYLKKIRRFTKVEWESLSENDKEKYTQEKETNKEIKKEIAKVKEDLIFGTLKSDKKYHEWIKNEIKVILPELTEKITKHEDGLKVNPFKYLQYMLIMNKKLEEKGYKLFQPISLRTSSIDKYVVFDTSTIKDIFCEINSNKTNEEIWNTYFKINKKKLKLKGYTFNDMISTDGLTVSIYFIKDSEIKNKARKIEAMTKARNNSKKNGKITEKEKEDKKIKQIEESKKRVKEKKETFKKLTKEEQEKIKLEIKKRKNKFEYIEDAVKNKIVYDKLKEKWDKNLIKVIDPGKRDLMTILGKLEKNVYNKKNIKTRKFKNINNERYKYSNKRRLKETKRLKINKLIENKKKEIKIENKILKEREQELNKLNKKTMEIDKFSEYVKLKIEIRREIIKEKKYNEYVKKQNFRMYINKRSHEDKLLNDIEIKYGKEAVFIIGDWSDKGKIKYISTPNLRMKKLLEKRFEVYLIDEFRTSKLYNKTKEEGKNMIIKEEKKKIKYTKRGEKKEQEIKTINKKMHSILTFKMSKKEEECKRTESINRDYNATLNMMNIVEYLLKHKKRPLEFRRTKDE